MTTSLSAPSDLLGSSLPDVIWLPHWQAGIEQHGSATVLAWSYADAPAAPAPIATTSGFVSLPRPVPVATLNRGRHRLRQRLKDRRSEEPPSAEELLAAFSAVGGQIEQRRQIPPGAPPFFGGAGVLDDFILLADQPHEAIQAFASHWGPLGICKHLYPWTHSLARRSPMSVEPVCSPLGFTANGGRTGWEPLSKWQEYSREARAITLEATALKRSRSRPQDKLGRLFARVATWLELAAVPLVAYSEVDTRKAWPCGFQATFAITGVFQILALQLLGVVAGGRNLAQCSHCGLPFVLTGHRKGDRRFCPHCVERKIPTRYAARDYRSRHLHE